MTEAVFVDVTRTPAGGRARRRELAAQFEAERREVEAGLLRDLGRPATERDRLAVENLSATVVKARWLRRDGRDDSDERRLLVQQMRGLGLKPAPAETAAKPDPMAAIKAYGETAS